VIAVQALVTACALPSFFVTGMRLRAAAIFALAFIVFSAILTNLVNPFDAKSIYDSVLIPIYISLGMSATHVRPKWMNGLLLFVLFIVLLEIISPTIYVALFDPNGYLSSTREWLGEKKANDAMNDGLYAGSYRSGGSQFSFTNHRVGGPFLEPISLGYFAFLMSTYYAGIHRGSIFFKAVAIVICLMLALSADSRIPTVLILLSTVFLTLRLRLPVLVLWLSYPIVTLVIYLAYVGQFGFLYGDTYSRISITFASLETVNIGQILVGMVPIERVGDSGILYMLRCVGALGMLVAVWFYSGAFTYRRGTNVGFFVVITIYLAITLMFGGASLSIKTGSLLGYLVGLAAHFGSRPATNGALGDPQPGSVRAIDQVLLAHEKSLLASGPALADGTASRRES
jgi:hypothetical protein